jgi:hypothetical protein
MASITLTGRRALINDVPVWQIVKELFQGSMRSIQSAPNGALVAWYPDKWGLYSENPYFIIEDIEVKDIKITRNDTFLATHVFAAGYMEEGQAVPETKVWNLTTGVVSIEPESTALSSPDGDIDVPPSTQPTALLKAIMNIPEGEANKYSADYIFKRYGARPHVMGINKKVNAESVMPFLTALWGFMDKWSSQFDVQASFTFMPELFPGARVEFAGHDIAMYVESVVHTFDYTGGFETNARLSCPTSHSRAGFINPNLPEPPLPGE